MYGGGFATIPAYLRDLFGTMQVGAIHGRLLTAWSAAGVARAGARQLHSRIRDRARRREGRRLHDDDVHHGRAARRRASCATCSCRPVGQRHSPTSAMARRSRMSGRCPSERQCTALARLELVAAWALVGIPLAWGVWQVFREIARPVPLNRVTTRAPALRRAFELSASGCASSVDLELLHHSVLEVRLAVLRVRNEAERARSCPASRSTVM